MNLSFTTWQPNVNIPSVDGKFEFSNSVSEILFIQLNFDLSSYIIIGFPTDNVVLKFIQFDVMF